MRSARTSAAGWRASIRDVAGLASTRPVSATESTEVRCSECRALLANFEANRIVIRRGLYVADIEDPGVVRFCCYRCGAETQPIAGCP